MFSQQVLVKGLLALLIAGVGASTAFAQATVDVAEHDKHGPHLVEGKGLSLYVYLPDAEVEGSACDASCAAAWPPLTIDGDLVAGAGVDEELLGTVARPDGAQQVTYDGWPLYRYIVDRAVGSVAGQGMGDEFYLLSPDRTVIGADLGGSQGAAAEADGAAGDDEEIDVDALMAEGEKIYASMCAGCHGAGGDEVLASHVARITTAGRTVEESPRLIRQIIYGGAYMPPFGPALSNEQIQAISTYVRNSFGHDFGPVTDEEVIIERKRFD